MLWRKMLRDLMENKGAYIACISVIVIGLMIFTSFAMVSENLYLSRHLFYTGQNFADGFAEVQAMPYSEIQGLRSIEGIKDIQGRLVKDVRALLPGREDNIYLRLVSVDIGAANPVNGVQLERGIPLDERELNIWVDNKFFAANKLELNDRIDIIAEGKKVSLRIVGVGQNPEFIYAMRTAGDIFPKPEEFGIAYLPYEMMKTLFQEKGIVNSIVFTLKPGVTYNDVEDRLKPHLKPYWLKTIYPRKDQVSHNLLDNELKQLDSMGKSLPVLFLAVASTILYIMLKRLIEHQRGQIGVLKALGYTRREILNHYLSYALTIGLIGGVLGGLLGIALAGPFTLMYEMYFNMPGLGSSFSLSPLLFSIFMALGFSLFAGYRGCKGVLTLQPAEAMRPPAPPLGKSVVLEKIAFFWNMLTVQGKMAIRNMFRHPARTAFLFLGMMFTFSLLASPWSMWDLSEKMMFDQFEKIETYDVKISLANPLDQKQVERELSRFPGVKVVEGKAEIPVTLKHNWHKKDVVLLGLPAGGNLHRILDNSDRQVEPPRDGILLSQRLAELLDADVGTEITLESIMLKDPDTPKRVVVVGVIPQYLGLNAYMELGAVQDLLGQGGLATTVMVSMDENYLPLLQEEYRNVAAINGIDDRVKMLRQMRELMATFSWTIVIYLLFGVIVVFAIIYNSSLITLSERRRELASMMVLGMTPAEVLSVITFEQWFISVFAMLAGIPLTKLMLVGLAQSVSSDVYSMPTMLSTSSMVAGFLVTVASIWFAQRIAARKISTLQIADVLKAGE